MSEVSKAIAKYRTRSIRSAREKERRAFKDMQWASDLWEKGSYDLASHAFRTALQLRVAAARDRGDITTEFRRWCGKWVLDVNYDN